MYTYVCMYMMYVCLYIYLSTRMIKQMRQNENTLVNLDKGVYGSSLLQYFCNFEII